MVPVPNWPTTTFPVVVMLLAAPSTASAALPAGATLSIRIPLVRVIAPPPVSCSVPALTVVAPVKLLVAESVSVPAPVLASAAVCRVPVCRVLPKVTSLPLVSTVAVTPSSIFMRLERSCVLPFHCSFELPVKSTVLVVSSAPWAKLSVPAWIVVAQV